MGVMGVWVGGMVSGYFRHSDRRQEEYLGSDWNIGKKMALGKSTEDSSKKRGTMYGDLGLQTPWNVQGTMLLPPRKPVGGGR